MTLCVVLRDLKSDGMTFLQDKCIRNGDIQHVLRETVATNWKTFEYSA